MNRLKLITIATLLFGCGEIYAQNAAINGICGQGAVKAITSGLGSSNYLQGVIPSCLVTVYNTGTLTPALFSTATMLGPVYFTNYTDTSSYPQITVRQEGTISCTVAPTVQLMDLGTNASTVYASATAIVTLALGTADGVFTGVGSSTSLTAGHYYGIAFSAGTCATAPTIDVTVYDTW
jgi:hypothetical protein